MNNTSTRYNKNSLDITVQFIRDMRRRGHTRAEVLRMIDLAEAEVCRTATCITKPEGRYSVYASDGGE